MKIQDCAKHAVTPARIFVTCLIILIAVAILQIVAVEIWGVLASTRLRTRLLAIEAKEQLSEDQIRTRRIRDAAKEFLPNGSIHLVSRLRPVSTESDTLRVFDTNDNLLWEGPHDDQPYEYLSWASDLHGYGQGFGQRQMRETQIITPEFSRTLEIPVGTSRKITQVWVYRPGSDLFTGYDLNGAKIGYAGSMGFADTQSGAKRFGAFRFFTAWSPPDSHGPILLWQTQRRIYQIDFYKKHVELIFESADADIESMNLHAWRVLNPGERHYVDPEQYHPLLHYTTEDGTNHLIMRNPDRHITVELPDHWHGWVNSIYRFTATKQEVFLRRDWIEFPRSPDYSQDRKNADKWFRDYRSQAKKHHVELYRVDSKGSLDLLNSHSWSVPARPRFVTVRRRPAVRRCVTQFSPPAYGAVVRLMGRSFWSRAYSRRGQGNLFYEMAKTLLEYCPVGWGMNLALSAAMMGFAFWHGRPRRTSQARFVFWLAFVAAFNLAGLLTYIALNHSAVIRCPACGRRRGLARVECARCEAQLPAPAPGKLDLIFES